jgi:hypothetical protein
MKMAGTLETSAIKRGKAYATFRVAGDNLDPEQVTKLLGMEPTRAHAKGQHYRRSERGQELVGKTGVWYFSTAKVVASDSLEDHVTYLLKLGIAADSEKAKHLRKLIEGNSLHAAVTFFWSGPPGAKHPSVPKGIIDTFKNIPAKIEEDFDNDYEPPSSSTIGSRLHALMGRLLPRRIASGPSRR